MSDIVVVPPSGADEVSVPAEGPLNLREAVQSLNNRRDEQESEAEKRGPDGRFQSTKESPPPSEAVDAAPPQEAPSETIEDSPADELPPIAPPRSWTKEDKEAFANLPREAQERISESEKKRERDFRSRQNEVAELKRRQEAELRQAHAARQQYEATLPHLVEAQNAAFAHLFPDIRSEADLDRLAVENPARLVEFNRQREKRAAYQAQLLRVQQARAADEHARWLKWSADQDAKVMEEFPDLADPEKAASILKGAKHTLTEAGYTEAELKEHFSGQRVTNFRDSRFQKILMKAQLWDNAQAALQKARTEPKPAPKLQRPGSPRTAKDADGARLNDLSKQLDGAKGAFAQARAAAKLRAAKRGLSS